MFWKGPDGDFIAKKGSEEKHTAAEAERAMRSWEKRRTLSDIKENKMILKKEFSWNTFWFCESVCAYFTS